MMRYVLLFSLLLPLFGYSQNQEKKEITISPTQKIPQTLLTKMAGVQYADPQFSPEMLALLINNSETAVAQIHLAFINYLKENCSLSEVILTNGQRESLYSTAPSQCAFVFPTLEIDNFKSDFLDLGKIPVTMSFAFCDNTVYHVQMVVDVNANTNPYRRFKREFVNTMVISKSAPTHRLQLPTGYVVPNAEQLAKEAKSSKYEGVYELFEVNSPTPERVAIYQDGETIRLLHLSGGYLAGDWKAGEQIGVLTPTASEKDFKGQFNDSLKNNYTTLVSFENEHVFTYTRKDGKASKYIKLK